MKRYVLKADSLAFVGIVLALGCIGLFLSGAQ
jgi:hypothetical protein